jgi:hypothetical protein
MELMGRFTLASSFCIAAVFAFAASTTISSTTEKSGNQHPGSAAVKGPATVTCTSATGNDPRNYPPSCSIAAPGYSGTVNQGKQVGTSGAGTVTLTCNGQAPLRCSAKIDQ